MLAKHDANEGQRQGGFSLIVNSGRGVAELMAQCRKCGASAMYGLELAWRLQTVTCPECGTSMRLTGGDVKALREGVIAARVRLDALTRKAED
jgi:RNase P subunit RPR2